jgi:hypothetical protein
MPNIEVAAQDLFSERPKIVSGLLEPLYVQPNPYCGFFPLRVGKQKILGAGPGLQSKVHPRDCWFRTFSEDIWCQYLEHWLPFDEEESRWFLESANLHVGLRDTVDHKIQPLVYVHTEPNFDGPEPGCSFKRSPHMHIRRALAGDPLPHSHLPLNLGNIVQVLTSVGELTTAISHAVKIVRCEIIDLYAVDFLGMSKENVPTFPWDVYLI